MCRGEPPALLAATKTLKEGNCLVLAPVHPAVITCLTNVCACDNAFTAVVPLNSVLRHSLKAYRVRQEHYNEDVLAHAHGIFQYATLTQHPYDQSFC